jgi:4-hydroxy-3-methylbut-2-enyl diphosphate reductase
MAEGFSTPWLDLGGHHRLHVRMRATRADTITLLLAAPRGFCAGVERAIAIVEEALARFGAPVFVRHEIVHNRHVVEDLRRKGAVFVDELDEVPEGTDRPVIFSAHGVARSVVEEARRRNLFHIDATCPLVFKVHHEAQRHHAAGRHVLLIGHAGHPEVIGTMGQLPDGAISLVETVEDAGRVAIPDGATGVAYVTQTTLSVMDTRAILAALKRRFPDLQGPSKEDICYATTNRQEAVRALAERADAVLVVGAPNSSNSRRLVEVAAKAGCRAQLVERADDIDWTAIAPGMTVGITAGASAPEVLVREVIDAFRRRFGAVAVEEMRLREENVSFKLPPELRLRAE